MTFVSVQRKCNAMGWGCNQLLIIWGLKAKMTVNSHCIHWTDFCCGHGLNKPSLAISVPISISVRILWHAYLQLPLAMTNGQTLHELASLRGTCIHYYYNNPWLKSINQWIHPLTVHWVKDYLTTMTWGLTFWEREEQDQFLPSPFSPYCSYTQTSWSRAYVGHLIFLMTPSPHF